MSDTIIMYENGKAVGGEGHPTDADEITFDNSGTDLVSEEVESAIKEVNAKFDTKADKTDIATVESGTTASRAYSVGELVYVSGTLYKVKTAIASGATFTVGTNIEVTNVSNAINGIIKVSTISKSVTTTASAQTETRIDVPQISGYKAIGIVSYYIPLTSAIVQPSIININDGGTTVTMRFVTNLSTTVTVSCKVMYVKNGFYS